MLPLRVLHVISGLRTGGAEAMLYKLAAALDPSRFENRVVSLLDCGTYGPRLEALGVRVAALHLDKGRLLRRVRELGTVVSSFRPQIIQGWMYHGNLAGTLARRIAAARSVLVWNIRQSLYDLDREKGTTALAIVVGATLSRLPHAIVYNSAESAGQHERRGYSSARRRLIPNGFDCALFRPDAEARDRMRRSLGFTQEPVVGFIARYHPMKDHRGFLRAAALVRNQIPTVRFVMVGAGVDPSNPDLRAVIASLQLERAVKLLGERPDVPDLLNAMDVLACASAWGEAFPNVLGEAMACGLPCVATDVGDSARVIADAGFVVAPRDYESLAHSLCSLLSMRHEQRLDLGAAARRRITDNYSISAVARQYEALYEESANFAL